MAQFKTETSVGLFVLAAIGVLIYMSFQIGSLRFATHNYAKYCLYSHDISGLNKKADVRIAGVKVGWIESVLFEEEQQRVKMCVMILKKYHLYADASAVIRQNGILGGKYLEILTGDARLHKLPEGTTLECPAQDSVSVDIILKKVNNIAGNIEEVTDSLKKTLGGDEGEAKLKQMMDGVVRVTDRVANAAESLDRLVVSNEETIQEALISVKELIPDIQEKFGKISNAIDRDFGRVATQIEGLMPPLTRVLESYNKNHGFVIKHKLRLF
jgi:phospholipid/cholesterol/gamma-HCH transport system substrate-binding protein